MKDFHIRVAEGLMQREPLLTSHWSYDFGVVWNAMRMLYEITGDPKYFRYIQDGGRLISDRGWYPHLRAGGL